MNVLILSKYSTMGASSRLRFFQYVDYLEKHGFNIEISSLLDNQYLVNRYAGESVIFSIIPGYLKRLIKLFGHQKYDLVWLEKELCTWAPSLGEFFLSKKVPYVVDYDDAVFHNYDLHPNPFIRALYKNKIDKVMKYSRLVIAGNEYLAKRAKTAQAQNVVILPTVIDAQKYFVTSKKLNCRPVVGWIGSPSTSRFVKTIKGPLESLSQQKKATINIVGGSSEVIDSNLFTYLSWSEDAEVELLQDMDIGIMPLDDSAFAKGKCGYKLIQYMACGLPVIASPVGVNCEIVEHGVNGFLAENEDDWAEKLNILINDEGLRREMGKNARLKVEKYYSSQVTAPILEKLLRSALLGSTSMDYRK